MNVRTLLLAAAAVAVAGTANAASIAGLYNTGFDAQGSEIALGTTAADGNWTLGAASTGTGYTGSPTAYASAVNGQFPIGPWIADSTTSRWITPTANVADSFDPSVDGAYDFTLSFNLSSLGQAAGARFTGLFAADNAVTSITLNGHSLAASGGGFSSWTSFASESGDFVAGKNTLVFDVDNFAQNGGNPTGLNVQFTNSAVPEPATWSMMLVGFAGLGAGLRASRRQAAAATV
jgi:hypothetical protein